MPRPVPGTQPHLGILAVLNVDPCRRHSSPFTAPARCRSAAVRHREWRWRNLRRRQAEQSRCARALARPHRGAAGYSHLGRAGFPAGFTPAAIIFVPAKTRAVVAGSRIRAAAVRSDGYKNAADSSMPLRAILVKRIPARMFSMIRYRNARGRTKPESSRRIETIGLKAHGRR